MKRVRQSLIAMVLMLSLGACSALLTPDYSTELVDLKPGQYRLDKNHSVLLFKVEHMGLSTTVGRFNSIDASLDFNTDDFTQTRLDAVVDTASVDTNNTRLDDTLRGSAWFNVAEFPQAVFTTERVKGLDDGRFLFTGNLTFLGIRQPVTLNVSFNGGATNMLTGKYTLGFTASGTIKREDFGIGDYPGVIGETVKLEIYAEFQRN